MRNSSVAGIGGIAFAVLSFVAVLLASPLGGTYKASDAADYLARGHRAAVFISAYVFMLGVLGLICLLARLRDAVAVRDDGVPAGRIFWGTSVAAAAGFATGWALVVSAPLSLAFGGKSLVIAPNLAYMFSEAGFVLIYGAASIMLGFALIVLVLAWGGALPAWLRWATLVGGIAAVAGPAFFPFFLVLIWSLVAGIWLLVGDRGTETAMRSPAA